ncbi:hypothetical protein RRSWK_03496 [Rhodopirellula sp. SWK7]|nr:hypothetical protein RRSWK_03496 [Rhodopirellula sp. SWK7]
MVDRRGISGWNDQERLRGGSVDHVRADEIDRVKERGFGWSGVSLPG